MLAEDANSEAAAAIIHEGSSAAPECDKLPPT
jgi:hypothetical protein